MNELRINHEWVRNGLTKDFVLGMSKELVKSSLVGIGMHEWINYV